MNDDNDLRSLISSNTGEEIGLCPGKVEFNSKIVLFSSITITCSGTKGSCIFDGNGTSRHFRSDTSDVTYSIIGLAFINGFADDSSSGGPLGGSLRSGNLSPFRSFWINQHI